MKDGLNLLRKCCTYRVGQKSKLSYFFHIFAKYWPIFTLLLPVDSVKNLLLSGMHTTFIMSLHYLVKYKYFWSTLYSEYATATNRPTAAMYLLSTW